LLRVVLVGKLSEIEHELALALDELRKTSRGIHPAVLAEGGLGAALRVLARRSVVPIELDVHGHAAPQADRGRGVLRRVGAAGADRNLLLSIRDDGRGGADPAGGSGLLGLTDRVEALGGSIHIRSTAGEVTQITAELPLEREAANA
jgi:signal transduction histidine kinase